jgi:hypothetical protein
MSDNYIVVPKTDSVPAREAYLQLMALCSNTSVKPEAIEQAIQKVEHTAKAYGESSILKARKSCQETKLELESVAKYYHWVLSNISRIRSVTQEV